MIHICFNLDNKYITPCKVLIRAIEENTGEKLTFHFIGIDNCDMGTKSICKFYPNPDLSYFTDENLKDYNYFSQAAMYRLLIPFMIETDRAIYLDIDTLVRKDIKTLWDKKIDLAGAVIDPCDIYHKQRLAHGAKNYYNSGVILFNSKKIRETMPDYKERILQAQKDFILDLKDQDIFNVVFDGHITNVGYEFNIDAHNLHEDTETKTTTKAKDKAFADPTIVHCMGKEKWWNYMGIAFCEEWDSYAREYIPAYRKTCIKSGEMLIVRN